ncbi:MAG: hypothetical protein PUB89_05970 [Oscillospiraceae bacterium]|nr:hypothetical protein [Oscillospiraceae bacterium]
MGCLFGSVVIPVEKITAALSTIGNAATITGAAFTLYSPDNIKKEEFETITQSCINNISRNHVNISMHNYDKFDLKGERYNCQEWYNNGYVNKYYYAGSSDAYRIIRATDFKPF